MNILVRRFTSIPTPQSDSQFIRKVKDLMLQGLHFEALQLYRNQPHLHVDAFISILPSLIKACSLSQTHHFLGLQLHCRSLKMGIYSESVVSNSIISFYAKFPDTKSARKVFDEMPQKDCISWNSMINCFVRNGNCVESLEMLKEMYEFGFVTKPELIASILSLCVRCGCTRVGKMIHALSIVDERFEKMVFLSTALLDLYWRSGDSVMTFRVFDAMEDKNEGAFRHFVLPFALGELHASCPTVADEMRMKNVEATKDAGIVGIQFKNAIFLGYFGE
ncbi:hypothetical protein L6452_08510 [Arctium lappa]|uniref:Uncharacterized protein n=1 Tax=Arctium lappa TaxID=4217 RepID=A0ACB9DHH4_ARCLA|nr:hypothetical protein L6452_08510 [Arctium lappa]